MDFTKAYGEVTAACSSCHQTVKLGFVDLQAPTSNPISDVFGGGEDEVVL